MDLTHARIQAELDTARYGRSLTLVEVTGSTNDDARAAALAGAPDGHAIVADAQSQGRGSRGRTWTSPPGQDLYVSVVARVPLALAELPPLTLAVGLAVAETADAYLEPGRTAQVKWPNDVWIDRNKCAGVLVETVSLGAEVQALVIGIGLNVNRRAFPADLETPATSLALASEAHADLDRASVLAYLLTRLEVRVDSFVHEGLAPVLAALDTRLALRGEAASCDGLHGVVEGVSAQGALLLRTPDGLRPVISGTLRPA